MSEVSLSWRVRLAITIISGSLFVSCASSEPSRKQISEPSLGELLVADYGEYPSDYERIVKEFLHYHLYDPESIKGFEITEPTAGWRQFHCMETKPAEFGYICWATYNAKNRMGGYTGYKKNLIMIKNGKVIFCDHDLGRPEVCGHRWGYKP